MKVEKTVLPEVVLLTRDIWRDMRGEFSESWQRDRYHDAGLPKDWAQDNVSHSTRHVLRGLHFQWPRPQGKLVSVLSGSVLDVAVDVRRDSPTFGQSVTVELSAERGSQLYVPEGFAHGFSVLSREAVVHYKCTDFYVPVSERTLLWNDPRLGICWPSGVPVLSSKDEAGLPLGDFAANELPAIPKLP